MYQSIFTWAGSVSNMRRFLALAVKNDEENRHMDESNCVDSLPIALVAEAVGEAMFQEKIPNA